MSSPLRSRHDWLASHLLILVLAATIAAQQPPAENPQTKPTESKEITGRVMNEAGQPLPGVNISVGDLGGSGSYRTATDSEGNFKAQGLDAGVYRVFATSPGYVSERPPANPSDSPTYYRPGDSVTLTLIKGGVITGTVTNGAGEPLVNASVRAFRVRDAEGKPLPVSAPSRERPTDDRGYYRIYGLNAGTYIVSVGGASQSFGFGGMMNPYANDVPTYAPASTRDTAAETVVRAGEEASADIRYRGEPGHSVSGRLTGAQTPIPYVPTVRLTDGESHFMIAFANVFAEDRTFQLNGISDGEYEISAVGGGQDSVASSTRRVSVKGSDVTGIELSMAPLASISGRVNIEADAKLNCGKRREGALRETLVSVRRDREPETRNSKDKSTAQASEPVSFLPTVLEVIPNDNGEINFRNLPSGTYRFDPRPPAGWYVRAITLGSPQKPSETNIARDGLVLKSGEKISGLTVNVTEGGAGLRGRIYIVEGQQLPANLRVDLVPVEKESAENVLRFFETRTDSDGSFIVSNIAPGHYWIIQRIVDESDSAKVKPLRQDAQLRSQLLKDTATRTEIRFQPCQRILDYELPLVEVKAKP